ncbi:MAG: hypothetical protein QOJ13_1349 [Gaiellales bacterium]|jgi:class 3 adenylate cyclase|nr:hypothetical protein [Gaiellales bacterium]
MPVCGTCRVQNPVGARFCTACGTALESDARKEERKLISVLFADLVGSTSTAERLDVEDVRDRLVAFHALVLEELSRYGATVEKFIGDAAVAVFGAPAAHEDDAERAVRAGIGIVDALLARNEQSTASEFHVRVGVQTGEALVALTADAAAGEHVASGDVVNTAARLQSAAPVDGVLVGDATYRATRDVIEYGPPVTVDAKGKAQPVPARRALRARARLGVDVRGREPSPLVGRQDVLSSLITEFAHAKTESGVRMVTLVGAPGIGKSRLVWELVRHLAAQPEVTRWRQGRSPPYGQDTTFFALAEMVKAEAGILESDDAEAASTKLSSSVGALLDAGEASWVEQHLRLLLGLEARADLRGDRRAEAFAAWRRFLDGIAARSPLVCAFEDIHWADDALLDFIEHLREWSTGPMLVLATARGELLERRPGWAATPRSTVINISPLSAAEIRELLSTLGGDFELGPRQRELLVANAGGNPLYAGEFVRMLIDRGAQDAEAAPGVGGALPVPESVRAIIAARVDALTPDDKAVLQDAAVVGRVFWPGAVAAVAGRGVWAVTEALRRLEQRELVRRRRDSSVDGELEYTFGHALVREVAYGGIVRARRGEAHLRAGHWTDRLSGNRGGRVEIVAHHYESALSLGAGVTDPALRATTADAVRNAALRALGLHAHDRAAELFARALALYRPDSSERPRLLLSRAVALALGDRPAAEALHEASAALVAAGEVEGAAEAESMLGWLLALAGPMDEAREADKRALKLLMERPASPAKALVLCRAGTHRILDPDLHDEGAQLLDQALMLARSEGLDEIEAEALQFAGMGRIHGGDRNGVADVERALSLALDLNSVVALSCYGNLADVRKRLGDLRGSAKLHADGLRAAWRFGVPVQVRRFRAEQVAHLYWSGAWDEATREADDYLATIEEGSPHHLEAEMRIVRGRMRLSRGDAGGALTDAVRALAFARLTGHPYDLLPALAFRARMELHQGGGEAAGLTTELLGELRPDHVFWAAWTLPDAVVALSAVGRAAELVDRLSAARMKTPWDRAAIAHAEHRFDESAAIYAEMGAKPEEAAARMLAGRSGSHGAASTRAL